MKTMTKNISTQMIMLAMVLGVLSVGEAEAGDRSSGIRISIGSGGDTHVTHASQIGYDADSIIPAGYQIDQELIARKAHGDVLKVTVTKSRWNGHDYVAYMLVEWGNLRGLQGFGPAGGPSNWSGTVKVDDGEAYVIKTIGFEQPRRGQTPQLTHKQAKKLAELREELSEDLAKAEDKANDNIDEAYDDIRNRRKLAKELRKIEAKFDKKVADLQAEYSQDVAKLLAKAARNNPAGGDYLIDTDDDEKVQWHAGVNGGTDGVLIKLILDDDDSEITIKAGGEKIKLETQAQRATRVVVRNSGVRVVGNVQIGGVSGSYVYSSQPSYTNYNRRSSNNIHFSNTAAQRVYYQRLQHRRARYNRRSNHSAGGHQCSTSSGHRHGGH